MDPGTVKIFTSSDVPRLRYIAGILLQDIMGLSCEVVTDRRKLGKSPVINYSATEIKDSFRINPDSLLFETDIKKRELNITEWRGLPVFFQSHENSDLPFDIFAASFYLISRYEEYLEFTPDKYGRFSAHSSFSFINGFLGKPVIDLWTIEWTRLLVVKLRNLVFRKNKFRSMVTFDIDQPFEYLGKNVLRSLGGLIREIGKKESKVVERYRTVSGGEKDPWDVFDYIFEKIDSTGSEAKFFVPVGDRSDYDRHPSWTNEDYRRLIRKVAGKFSTGLHPSFNASLNHSKLKSERERLKSIITKEITFSRFHFLNIKFPDSYNNLIAAGVKEDYSMGYHDEPGFRAGISRPFNFFDLRKEKETDLRIFPFQVMDATMFQYKKMKPSDAGDVLTKLIEETKNAGGLFISIWHNTSLLGTEEWKGWREIFETMLISRE